ncbi:hypothetical protein MNBD_PLANCTO03-1658 [hydrothermal vent metagenome]|uniref:Glycosyltransferase RgtA/B/C/D-like domain-containing protein n=1 Tax=hydrothermal vent metagenome TaxID=652676 RepID=A0A3B1E105_9ZZZZ
MRRVLGWVCASRLRQMVLLMLVCSAVFLPGLGSTGLSMSEGHRVIPAWEMLDDARAGEPHWLVPRMFEAVYLRKPPGMMWAIASSSAALGETEFAARLPSVFAATLLALSVWFFATRWFGSPWGLAAGLAQALLPVTWPSARSAEIESLHMFTTGAASLLVLDMLLRPGEKRGGSSVRGVLLFVLLLGMFLTKGLSGVPFVAAAAITGAVFLRRSQRWPNSLAIVLAASGAVVLGRALTTHDLGGEPAVMQGVGAFLWEPGKRLAVVTLGVVVLVTMLPASLALLFPWGPDAKRERQDAARIATRGTPPEIAAQVLAVASVASLLILTLVGISNPRYGLPICALLTPMVAYVARGGWSALGGEKTRGLQGSTPEGAFVSKRPAIARAMFFGSPLAWPIVLLVAAGIFVGVLEPGRRASSGREAGIALATHLPDGAEVWADEMIEARPEVLLYAVREAKREGRKVRVRWLKPDFMPSDTPEGLLLLLREDDLADEVSRFAAEQRFGGLTEITRGEVHKYTFVLCRIEGRKAE